MNPQNIPDWIHLVIVVLATWRIVRVIITDDFPPVVWFRSRLHARFPGESVVFDDDGTVALDPEDPSRGVVNGRVAVVFSEVDRAWIAAEPHWLGRLFECPWCLSPYVAGVVLGVSWWWPPSWWLWLALAVAGLAALISERVDG